MRGAQCAQGTHMPPCPPYTLLRGLLATQGRSGQTNWPTNKTDEQACEQKGLCACREAGGRYRTRFSQDASQELTNFCQDVFMRQGKASRLKKGNLFSFCQDGSNQLGHDF